MKTARHTEAVGKELPAPSPPRRPLRPASIPWPLLVVLTGYAATAFIVPILAPVSINDDWVYARSVEILVREGRFQILELSGTSLVFQVAWGALFAQIFGMHLGVLRLATFVLMLLSGIALYGLCRELGLKRSRATLGTAVYLFNPLSFSLAYTFMTDGYLVALVVISTFFYVRGLRPDSPSPGWILVGSMVASAALLVRQQGLLIPVAVFTYLLASRRLRFNRRSVLLGVQAFAIPVLVAAGYWLWAGLHATPGAQQAHLQAVLETSTKERLELVARVTYLAVMYIGLFTLPLVLAGAARLPSLLRSIRGKASALLGAWTVLIASGLVVFGREGRRMPYLPHFLNPYGIGPTDLHGERPELFGPGVLVWFTVLVALAALVFGIIVLAQVASRPAPAGAAAGIAMVIGAWQLIGAMVPSHLFRNWPADFPVITLDRYLVTLLPFAVCLGLWALRDVRLSRTILWSVTALVALFSVVGTRDFLVFHTAVWDFARDAQRLGIPKDKLEAGAGWDGYHLSDGSWHRHPPRTPNPAWWVFLFGYATDSSYTISTVPLQGYNPIQRREYSAWLQKKPTHLYLSRRKDVSGPP